MASKTLRIIPIGGAGEVGKNMIALEYGENILVIDAGIMFPENDMLGIDYIIPDMAYLQEKRAIVRGIVITHGHEDHTGAVRHVMEQVDAPIFATPLTRGLIEVKLRRGGVLEKSDLRTVRAGESAQIGPFQVEFFHVAHSIPDGVGLGIETPAGLVLHSGDYKFDHTPVDGWPTDFGKLAELGAQGVLVLMADSTNADKPGWTPSESVIDEAFDKVFRQAEGRILIASFASLISRMAQVGRAAEHHSRKMAFVGRSMVENSAIAQELGYLDLPGGLVVPLDHALSMQPDRVVLMCTGTQGEPSSILGRLSRGRNRDFDIHEGDTVVFSSHPIPGNEEMINRTINRLFQRGAKVIYEKIAPVHVSGHASQEEMKLLLQLVKPKYLMPIHGELRHLHQHARLAQEIGIPEDRIAVVENGTAVEFKDGRMMVSERIPGGYVFVDGSGVGDIGPSVMRQREALARDGFVAVHIEVDEHAGRLATEPEIITKGFIYLRDSDDLLDRAQERIEVTVREHTDGNLEADIENDLSRLFYSETRRRPMIFVFASFR